jgi:hypothetical protein
VETAVPIGGSASDENKKNRKDKKRGPDLAGPDLKLLFHRHMLLLTRMQ